MKRGRFSDERIIGILKEQEAGAATADVCRRRALRDRAARADRRWGTVPIAGMVDAQGHLLLVGIHPDLPTQVVERVVARRWPQVRCQPPFDPAPSFTFRPEGGGAGADADGVRVTPRGGIISALPWAPLYEAAVRPPAPPPAKANGKAALNRLRDGLILGFPDSVERRHLHHLRGVNLLGTPEGWKMAACGRVVNRKGERVLCRKAGCPRCAPRCATPSARPSLWRRSPTRLAAPSGT